MAILYVGLFCGVIYSICLFTDSVQVTVLEGGGAQAPRTVNFHSTDKGGEECPRVSTSTVPLLARQQICCLYRQQICCLYRQQICCLASKGTVLVLTLGHSSPPLSVLWKFTVLGAWAPPPSRTVTCTESVKRQILYMTPQKRPTYNMAISHLSYYREIG